MDINFSKQPDEFGIEPTPENGFYPVIPTCTTTYPEVYYLALNKIGAGILNHNVPQIVDGIRSLFFDVGEPFRIWVKDNTPRTNKNIYYCFRTSTFPFENACLWANKKYLELCEKNEAISQDARDSWIPTEMQVIAASDQQYKRFPDRKNWVPIASHDSLEPINDLLLWVFKGLEKTPIDCISPAWESNPFNDLLYSWKLTVETFWRADRCLGSKEFMDACKQHATTEKMEGKKNSAYFSWEGKDKSVIENIYNALTGGGYKFFECSKDQFMNRFQTVPAHPFTDPPIRWLEDAQELIGFISRISPYASDYDKWAKAIKIFVDKDGKSYNNDTFRRNCSKIDPQSLKITAYLPFLIKK